MTKLLNVCRTSALYRIHWRCSQTGHAGVSNTEYPQAAAQHIADRLNRSPAFIRNGLTHWIEPSQGEGKII